LRARNNRRAASSPAPSIATAEQKIAELSGADQAYQDSTSLAFD
jgi:hypothetical protein